MINFFKDTSIYGTCSHSYILNSEGLQISCSSITIAPTPSAAARAAAEKHLQDIYKQELKDYKQEYIYKAALNQATLKALAASIAQAKLAMEEIH
jgi:siroheme synthase (precorrin-2 oxidase/ferrochelatase)